MQTSFISKINISTLILIIILLSVIILIANSIYLILILSILLIILSLLTNKSVKSYIHLVKNIKFLLLFIFVAYIIVFRNILGGLALIYKIILIALYVKQITLNINFQNLNNGIKTLLRPLKFDKFSYNILIFIYFVKFYVTSKKQIFANYDSAKKFYYNFSLRYNILPRLFLSISKVNRLESSLKLKFCKNDYEAPSLLSNIILAIFFLLFVVVVLKEVIL